MSFSTVGMWSSNTYTDTGLIRSANEDAILDLNAEQLWLVADGMGGHANGRYASQLVTQLFSNYHRSPLPGVCKQRVIQILSDSNAQLIEKAEREHTGVIGCTVALLQIRDNSVLCSWSGDSRIYRLRDGDFKQLTRDHSHQSAAEDHDQLRDSIFLVEPSEMLTKAIGGDTKLLLEHCWYQLRPGDSFLLCTDGLTKEANDEEIRSAMIQSSTGEQALEELSQLYQQRGARDNVAMVWVGQTSAHEVDSGQSESHNASAYYL